ncbi:hypothetical protein RhiirA1_446886 [Rhizophagus irregularis]|uniref:Uncharacterized protein n=1 Tax=Rhizophagus irregularis TaxID=588596 RepID=A0A2N0QW37_9GLOM|nr:hypothetical protein RhiirA1_446886 [Rhizophagus irregularis]
MIEDDDDNQSNSVDNRTPENQANSNDEIRATNTQDNLENQSNANSGDDTNVQESESQSRRNSSRRRTSPRITREQEKFQALLQELSTPAKGEKAENVDEEEDTDGSVSQSLARLYQKATRAGLRVTKANQDEILCWYKYAEGFENRVREIRSQDSSVTDPTARSRAYREVSQHLPGITEANLQYVNHKYFDRTYSEWSIIGFLNECTIEPLRNKIGQYLTSLENIINTEKGRRRDKAQQLYNQYKMDTRPDRALARKWDSDRSHNQFHIHQPTFTNGGTNNVNISGLVEGGTFNAGSNSMSQNKVDNYGQKKIDEYFSFSRHRKRQNENDYEEELPSTPPNKIRATTRTLRETSPTSLLYDEDTSSSDSEIRPTLLINVFQDQQQKPVAKQSEQSGSVPIPKIDLNGYGRVLISVSFKDKHTRTPLNIGVVNFHDNSCTKPLPSSMITHIQNQMENEEDSTIFFDDNKKFGIVKFEIDVDEDVIGFLDEFWNCKSIDALRQILHKNSVHNRPNFNFDINYAYQFFNHMYNLYSNDMLAQTLTESEYTAYVWTPLLHYAFMDKGEIRISSGEVSSTAYEKLKKLAQIQEKSGPRMDSSAVILSIGQEVLIQENGRYDTAGKRKSDLSKLEYCSKVLLVSAYLALPTVSRPEIHKFEVYMIQTNELSLSLYVASYVFENTICMFGLTDITIPRTIEAFPKCVEAVFKVLSWKARTRKNTKIFHELIGKSASQHHEKKYFSPKKIANQAKP